MPERLQPSFDTFLERPRSVFEGDHREVDSLRLVGEDRPVNEARLRRRIGQLLHGRGFWGAIRTWWFRRCMGMDTAHHDSPFFDDDEVSDLMGAMLMLAPPEMVPTLEARVTERGQSWTEYVVALPGLFDDGLEKRLRLGDPAGKKHDALVRGKWYRNLDWTWRPRPWLWPRSVPPRRLLSQPRCRWFEYYLFPGGMPRTLYGSYLLYLMAHRDLVDQLGVLPWLPFRKDAEARLFAQNPTDWPPLRYQESGLSDEEWIEDRILNGAYPAPFRHCDTPRHRRQGIPHDWIYVEFDWNDVRFRESALWDGLLRFLHFKPALRLPNLRAYFSKVGDQRLRLERIDVQYRRWTWGSVWIPALDLAGWRTLRRPTPGETTERERVRWVRAMRLLRGQLFVQSEIEVHLARCHYLAEFVQVGLNIFCGRPRGDDLTGSWEAWEPEEGDPMLPVWRLVAPHVAGADVLNAAADYLITGNVLDMGILSRATPLSSRTLERRIARDLGAVDWKGFRPRKPLVASDVFADAAGKYWTMLYAYVDNELPRYEAGLPTEIRRFSAELRSWGVRRRRLQGTDKSCFVPSLHREIPDERSGPAFSIVETREDLVQFCTFIVYSATFLHTWANNSQWEDGGDPDHAPMAIRASIFRDGAYGAHGLPDGTVFGLQRLLTNGLTKLDMGYVKVNDMLPRHSEQLWLHIAQLGGPFAHPQSDDDARDFRLRLDHIRSRVCA